MKEPLASSIGQIKAIIQEVNTSVNPPVAHVRETTTGGVIVVNLIVGPSGSWVTPKVGETWWLQYLGTRWTLLAKEDRERGSEETPGTSDYVELLFEISEEETDLVYKGVVRFNSAATGTNTSDISHYIVSWVACSKDGVVGDGVKAEQYTWYPNKKSDGTDAVVDSLSDSYDYIVNLPTTIANPKTTYYKARIRAVSKSGTLGSWTSWTTPALPVSQAYNLPPQVEKPNLTFQVAQSDDKTLLYNAVVSFKDVGYWDLPGGDFVDDIDRYEVQLQPYEYNSQSLGTVKQSINASTQQLKIKNITGVSLPTTPFNIKVDKEIMTVVSVSGDTLTVLRAQQSSVGASHSSGKSIKTYKLDEEVETDVTYGDLTLSSKDQQGTLDSPIVVADADDVDWPLLGILSVSDGDPNTDDFLSADPDSDTFDVVIDTPEILQNISDANLAESIYLVIDSELMKIRSFELVSGSTYSFTVDRGQDSQPDSHADASNVYLQNWIPIFNLINSVKKEDNVIKVAMLDSWTLPNNFSIKLGDNLNYEIMRVVSKKRVGTNEQNQGIFELTVFRGLQNTSAQDHAIAIGYYSIGHYYTHIFTAIPNPAQYWWSARVRAVDRYNRKGPWSDATDAFKASLAASALPSAPTEVALDFTRNHRGREWSITCEVRYNGVQYDIQGSDAANDVSGYQVRLLHSDGSVITESIDDVQETFIVSEPPRSGNLQRQLYPVGQGYILLASNEPENSNYYEIMYVNSSTLQSDGTWQYSVTRNALNTTSRTFNSNTLIFFFPPQNATTNANNSDPLMLFGDVYRYSTTFSPVRNQWWYLAQVRTIDSFNRFSPWSKPSGAGTASDTTRPPVPYNINLTPYDNNTVKVNWSAPSEPNVSIPSDISSLLQDSNNITTSDFAIPTTDISYFKLQLWSEDPYQEIPDNVKAFGINAIETDGTSVLFAADVQTFEASITSARVASGTVTLTVNNENHGITVGKEIDVIVNEIGSLNGIFIVTAVGSKSVSFIKTGAANLLQTSCTGSITYTESLRDWFKASTNLDATAAAFDLGTPSAVGVTTIADGGSPVTTVFDAVIDTESGITINLTGSQSQYIYLNDCYPTVLNGKQTISSLADDSFTINVAVDPQQIGFDTSAIVRPFDVIQASDFYETYPIHYFSRPVKSSTSTGLQSCVTAVVGDICYVSENNSYWKLKDTNPTQLSSWTKLSDTEVNVTGLLFFDQYVATTTRTIAVESLPIKVWVRVCSVDDSGNSSSWSVSGPFFTRDIFKPQNVILDYDNTSVAEFDLGDDPSLSSAEAIPADGGDPTTTDFDAIIDANLDQVLLQSIDNNNEYLLGKVYGVNIQWNEVLNPDSSITDYEIELQGGRMFAQVWQDSLSYWGNTISQDVLFGGLADDATDSDLTLNVIELSNVPAPEFYIRIDDEIMRVKNVVRDWNDEARFVNAIYEIDENDRGLLGTTAAAHSVKSLIYKVQVENLKVLELYSEDVVPIPDLPFEITIGGEKLTVIDRQPANADFDNIWNYTCWRDRKNGQSLADFEHDGINYRLPIFDAIESTTEYLTADEDSIDQNDIVTKNFTIAEDNIYYRGRVRVALNDGTKGTWSDWTFWADPRDFIAPLKPILTAEFNSDNTALDVAWNDGLTNNNTYQPTIFNNVASKSVMLQLNARIGDIAIITGDSTLLEAFMLTAINPGNIANWKKTLVPISNPGSINEIILSEGPDKIGGSLQDTDYYEIQVSRVPKEGKSVNSEGSLGILVENLIDAAGVDSIINLDPLKVFTKYPRVGDKLQIGSGLDLEIVTISEAPADALWNSSQVPITVTRGVTGTSFHAAGTEVKWIDITYGDFLNNYQPSFEYIYLWQHDPLLLDTSASYLVDDIGDYLYAVRVRAKDASGNASDWNEVLVRPDGLPIPVIEDLKFSELADTPDQISATLTFTSDISPEYNLTQFIPELMPALQTRLLNDMTTTSTDVVISSSANVPNPNEPDAATNPGIGSYYAFIEDEVVVVTSRTEIASWPNLNGSAYKLSVTRAGLDSTAQTHKNGCQFQWFYHPTIKQIEYGISYSGAISTAPVEVASGTYISDTEAEFTANFDGTIQSGRWYQGRAKSMSNTLSSSWSLWSSPLRALHETSITNPDPGDETQTPLKPNPVRSLIIDVDSKRVNISWLAPIPNQSTSSGTHIDSVEIATIDKYSSNALSDALTNDWDSIDINSSDVEFAAVTTVTNHNFNGIKKRSGSTFIDSTIDNVAVPMDEITISGAFAPFNGTFPVLATINDTKFIIPIQYGDSLTTPQEYPLSGANNNALATRSDKEISDGSEIDHYIVSYKKAADSTVTLAKIKSGEVKWLPILEKDTNCTATHKRFKLREPASDLSYFAKVIAVSRAGKKSEPRYARGDLKHPPKPRINSVTINSGKYGRRYFAMVEIVQEKFISDIDINNYRIQWFVSSDPQKSPAEVAGAHERTIKKETVVSGKSVKIGFLTPNYYLFVRAASHDRDGNLSQWTLWKRKKIVTATS